nr:uncharacterized mitochondrial protein AtMg00810-like [Tanacetum cinerariifolium]
MVKVDIAPLAPKLWNNRTAYSDYLKHTQEETTSLREIVEHERSFNPLNTSLDYAFKKTVKRKVSKPTGKVFTNIVYIWRPTGRTFTIVGNACTLTRITTPAKMPLRKPIALESNPPKPGVTLVVQIVLWYLDSGCFKHMTGDRSQLTNFVDKFLGTVKFGNEHVANIMGYGDYHIVNVTISRVYFLDGLGHNLFSVGQFCDLDLEVAFHQHTCFIRNLEGVDLLCDLTHLELKRSNELYQTPHLNFGAIKNLARQGLVRGLPKLKFQKDHLCSASAMGKSKKKSHRPKSEDTNQEKLYLLHMDLCGPMRVESVNGKKYILVIVDDYSRFTWVKCLRLKDEAPDFIIKFLKMIQVGISHETSVARSPQQNGVVERRNRTLIEAASTIENLGKLQPKTDIEDNHDIEIAHMDNDPLFGMPIPEVSFDQSSSTDSIHTIIHLDHQISKHNNKWTKDHPLENIIGQLARPVSTKLKLYEQALFCYYNAFLTSVEPKAYKDALTQSCWIEAMQEELNEFERLEVWELVPRPDKVMIITLKWIYKVKTNWEISQSHRGIFINQSKYALESLKKYGFESCDLVDTPMVEKSKLDEDKEGKAADPSQYRGMIGILLCLTSSRPNLQFAICMCARYQAWPTKKHLHAVKRIFRYLQGTVNRGLWYLKDSFIAVTAFADADHAGCQDTRHSTSGSLQFMGDRLISWSSKRQKLLRYPVRKLNTSPYPTVVLKFSG